MTRPSFGGGGQIQMAPFTKMVKLIVIVTVSVWFVGNVILEQFILSTPVLTAWLGLSPVNVIKEYFIWQPFTYIFMHEVSPLPIVFNMLMLWWLGGELESVWGSKFFALYYFICGVGAGFLYCFGSLLLAIFTSKSVFMITPVIGASSAIFGLMVAYGMIFSERPIYFMFFFPMKAKHFVWILVGIELVMVLNNTSGHGRVASLAHLGGVLVGYVYLKFGTGFGGGRGETKKKRSKNLRLVVNNTDFNNDKKPKYWH